MIPQIHYSDLATLNQQKQTKLALYQYLIVVSELLKNQYPNYPSTMVFDIDNQKCVFMQKASEFVLETGFYWDMSGDLYFGMKIIVPNEIDDVDLMLYEHNWSSGVEESQFNYYQLCRYVDMMIVGNPSGEYIDVLQKFKEICLESNEVVGIVEKTNSRK